MGGVTEGVLLLEAPIAAANEVGGSLTTGGSLATEGFCAAGAGTGVVDLFDLLDEEAAVGAGAGVALGCCCAGVPVAEIGACDTISFTILTAASTDARLPLMYTTRASDSSIDS